MVKKSVAIPVSIAQINKHRTPKAPKVKRLSRAKLIRLVGKAGNSPVALGPVPDLELSGRHPYDAAGGMDFYMPSRWDTTSNLVFMKSIVTGSSPGEWEGTAGYVSFQAPANGTYLVVGNFSGFQITMKMQGPWGEVSAFTATTSDSGAVTALWTATAGQKLNFTLNCTGGGMGYLESIQIFHLT
jgi:hypothetical protein